MARGIRIGAGGGPSGDLLVPGVFQIAGYPHVSSVGSGSGPPPVNYTASLQTGIFTLTGLPHTSIANELEFVNGATLPAGTQGAAYSDPLVMSAGQAPYTFTISSGTLPPGISLSNGALTGTPTVQGTFAFTLQCNDSAGQLVAQAFTLTVVSASVATTAVKFNPGHYLLSYGWNASVGAAGLGGPSPGTNAGEINSFATASACVGYVAQYSWGYLFPVQGIAANAAALTAHFNATIWSDFLAQQSVRPGTPFRGYWRTTQYKNVSQNGTTGTSTTNASGLIPAYILQAPSGLITVSTGQTTLPLSPNPTEYGWWASTYVAPVYALQIGANLWHGGQNQALIDDLTYLFNQLVPNIPGLPQYNNLKMKDHPLFDQFKSNDEISYAFGNGGGWLNGPPTAGGYAPTLANAYACLKALQGSLQAAAPSMLVAPCCSFGIQDGSNNTSTGAQLLALLTSFYQSGNGFTNSDLRGNEFAPTWGGTTDTFFVQFFVGNILANMNVNVFTTSLLNPPGGGTDFRGKMEYVGQVQGSDYTMGLAAGATKRSQSALLGVYASGQYAQVNSYEWCYGDYSPSDGLSTVNPWGTYVYKAIQAMGQPNGNLATNRMRAPALTGTPSGTTVVLTLTAQNGVTFNLYRTTVAGGLGTLIGNTAGTTFTDSSPPLNAEVYYTAAMTNANGTGPQCAQVLVSTFQNGYDGTLSINAAGVFVNGNGNPIELKGVNIPFDSQIMGAGGDANGGDWTINPGGTYFGSDGPPWPMLARAGVNYVRFTLNAAAFLNLPMGVLTGNAAAPGWSGTTVPGDPALKYRALLSKLIDACRQYGMYWDADLHWTAPAFTFGGTTHFLGTFDQSPFIDYDMGLPFWTAGTGAGPLDATGAASTGFTAWAMANKPHPVTGILSDCTFEIFNEPYPDGLGAVFSTGANQTGTILTYQQWMLQGGWASIYDNQSDNTAGRGGIGIGAGFRNAQGKFAQQWRSPGYQAVLTGIRALGCNQPILANTTSFAHRLSDLAAILPTDTVSPSQVATAYHGYEFGTSGYPYAANGGSDSGTNGAASALNYPAAVIAGTTGLGRKIPILWTEYAPTNGAGSGASNSGFMRNIHAWMNAQPKGSTGGCSWTWNPLGAGTGTGVQNEMEACYSANITFTASQAGTTLTVTSTPAGGVLEAGSVLTAGGPVTQNTSYDRPYIVAPLSGTGGAGTYQMSSAQVFSATGLTAVNVLWIPGQGQDDLTWFGGAA